MEREKKMREVGYWNSCPTLQHYWGEDSFRAPGLLWWSHSVVKSAECSLASSCRVNRAPYVALKKKKQIFSISKSFRMYRLAMMPSTTPYFHPITDGSFCWGLYYDFHKELQNLPLWTTKVLGPVWMRLRSVTVVVFLPLVPSYNYYLWIQWQTVDGCFVGVFISPRRASWESDPQISTVSPNDTLQFYFRKMSSRIIHLIILPLFIATIPTVFLKKGIRFGRRLQPS